MSEIFTERAVVVRQSSIGDGIFDLVLRTSRLAQSARAGQFVSLYSADASKLLPRPISICEANAAERTLRLVYRVTGEGTGTEEFSRLCESDTVRVMGPLGNGYELSERCALLIGGGIGIPPMLQLAKELRGKYPETEFVSVLGYRDADTFLLGEFRELGPVAVATENGSVGTAGNVLDAIRERKLGAEVIYACGPKPMLRALQGYAAEMGITCFLSLEERMACGIGACLACVCGSTDVDAHSNVRNKRICKDGPVFDAREVVLS